MTGTALVPSGPVAVVTGATRGLGLLVAEELGRQGHRLVICARSEDGLAKATAPFRCTAATASPASTAWSRGPLPF